jgi:hypothetical protein
MTTKQMTDEGWTTRHLDEMTERPRSPDAAAAPTSQASTLNKSAGDGASFKLTREEREAISNVLDNYKEGRYPTHCDAINAVEDAINEGWQTCTCRVDTAD